MALLARSGRVTTLHTPLWLCAAQICSVFTGVAQSHKNVRTALPHP